MNAGQPVSSAPIFPPPRRRGLILHAAIVTVLGLAGTACLLLSMQQQVGAAFVGLLLLTILFYLPIPLAAYPGPGLILNGERDATPRRGEPKFLAAMQHGQSQVIANAGHACNIDQPEAYNQAVRAFAHSIGWITD